MQGNLNINDNIKTLIIKAVEKYKYVYEQASVLGILQQSLVRYRRKYKVYEEATIQNKKRTRY